MHRDVQQHGRRPLHRRGAEYRPSEEPGGGGERQMEGRKHHAAAIEPVTQHTSGKVARGATDVERGGDRSGRRWREAAILREEEGEPEHEAVACLTQPKREGDDLTDLEGKDPPRHLDKRVAACHRRSTAYRQGTGLTLLARHL